jgi:hypothetical protein
MSGPGVVTMNFRMRENDDWGCDGSVILFLCVLEEIVERHFCFAGNNLKKKFDQKSLNAMT